MPRTIRSGESNSIITENHEIMFSYDTAYQHFGYDYQNELVEKQGTGPTAADFIPFFASFSLPLSAALATFIAIIVVMIADS